MQIIYTEEEDFNARARRGKKGKAAHEDMYGPF
jgi:hypothetical protein